MSSWEYGPYWLDSDQMLNNAKLVQQWGWSFGWSDNAICAILGNMQEESTINPGIYGDNGNAYGLVQWNPYTKYSLWAGTGWKNNGNKQMERINYEANNEEQWFYNDQLGLYPYCTFSEFVHDSTTPIETLADWFCWFYEHPTNPIQPARATNARYWYNTLDWEQPPDPPDPPDPPEPEPFPYWILFKFRGRGLH